MKQPLAVLEGYVDGFPKIQISLWMNLNFAKRYDNTRELDGILAMEKRGFKVKRKSSGIPGLLISEGGM